MKNGWRKRKVEKLGLYRVEAVVVKGMDYGEADRILTLYTKEEGKLNVIAKGVKKLKSRMRGSVQPFSHSGFILYAGRGNLDTVTQADLIEPFNLLRNDLKRWAYANYVVESLNGLVPERLVQKELFILLVASLHLLAVYDPKTAVSFWHVKMLSKLGYAPQFENCTICGRTCGEEILWFSAAHGGLLCKECSDKVVGKISLHRGTIAVWNHLSKVNLNKLGRFKIGQPELQELNKLIERYLEYIMEKPLKSIDFLGIVGEDDKNNLNLDGKNIFKG